MSATRMQLTVSAADIRHRTARGASTVLAPAPVAGLVLLIAAARSTSTSAEFGIIAAVAIGWAVLLPRLCIEYGVQRGWWSQSHLPRRQERALPLAVGAVCVVTAILLVQVAGAPRAVTASLGAMACVLAIALIATMIWKVSLHAAAMAGAVVIVSQLLGAMCILLVPLVVLVAWSRLELREHTLAQVGAGVVVGVVGSMQAYLLGA
jgi:glucan phosphoethanolaminetransferase (alkaline phosphatase superfamily)